MKELSRLQNEWYDLNKQAKEIDDKRKAIEAEMANVIAASRGISVGTIVVQSTKHGWGMNEKTVKTRYRVVSFKYACWKNSGGGIDVIATTIRKDGTDGQRRELYGNYEIENTSTEEPELHG